VTATLEDRAMNSTANSVTRRWLLLAPTVVVVAIIVAAAAVIAMGAPSAVGEAPGNLAFALMGGLAFTLVGATILSRRPGHRIGRLMVAIGLLLALSISGVIILETLDPSGLRLGPITRPLRVIGEFVPLTSLLGGSVLLMVWFPDGRRTSRLGLIAESSLLVPLALFVVRLLDSRAIAEDVVFMPILGAYGLALVDLAVRYRRSDGQRRAQIRWLLASTAATAGLIAGMLVFGDAVPELWTLWIISAVLPTVAIGIAVTRYHLYDIDRIISRTIGYGVVSAVLFGVFAGLTIVLQGVVNATTRNDPVVVAISTLGVAALFNPLRTRVQTIVDRRFDRARYDAERTAERFSGRLRDEIDLATLAGELQRTAVDAVAPAASGVWLRSTGVGR